MYKLYPRLPEIKLPLTNKKSKSISLEELISTRESKRKFSTKPITVAQLSKILFFSVGIRENDKNSYNYRNYPSAGAKYPLEVYPIILNCKNLATGIYHYNVLNHSLDQLLAPMNQHNIKMLQTTQFWYESASVIFIITTVFSRTTQKYGNKGIGFSLIESGLIGQNISLLCEAQKLGCCFIGELKGKGIAELLDIDTGIEIPLYAIAIGNSI